MFKRAFVLAGVVLVLAQAFAVAQTAEAPASTRRTRPTIEWPPALPEGAAVVTDSSPAFLTPPETLRPGVKVATVVPTVDFMYYPEQNYRGAPWSNWGEGVVGPDGKYYSAIGDHGSENRAEGPKGNVFVYEYDPVAKTLRTIVNVRQVLGLPEGHYVPSKIHGRLDFGSDGKLYFATHRGGASSDQYHFKGDWVYQYDPATGVTTTLIQGPIAKHCIPASVLDPVNMIFYGGTIFGSDAEMKSTGFFAYDIRNDKVLYAGGNGCYRFFMMARSTGKVYFEKTGDDNQPAGVLMRYDPASGKGPEEIGPCPGIRAATMEGDDGMIYAVTNGQRAEVRLWSFNTRTETVTEIGEIAVGVQNYIASIARSPCGRYLYFVAGAHGGAEKDNAPLVQYDLKTNTRTVIAFLMPFYKDKYGLALTGTFSTAVSPEGDKVYVTWQGGRGGRWDTCALTVIHVPAELRRPAGGRAR